jgi:hypothetical protein
MWHWLEVSDQLHTPAALPPVPIQFEAGWVPEQVWTIWRSENSCPYRDSNSDPSVVQPVGSRYTDCTIVTLLHPMYVRVILYV